MAGEEPTQEESFDLAALQARLRPGEVVLDYLLGPSALHVAVIHSTGLDIIGLPVPSMTELRRTVMELSSGPRRSSLRHLAMQRCGTWLFPPVLVEHLTGIPARRIYVVPTGPLWRIPFPWLEAHRLLALQRWEVALVPAARFVGSAAKLAASQDHACVIGHPGTPRLVSVETEVGDVEKQLGCPRLFGPDATPSRVLAALSSADIVHFACHGTCDPISPLMSCLHLEPDETHPDGYLLLQEVLEIPVQARIAVLSACHTARSEGPVSFPESLAHVLLGAGAELVVASLWEANDQECREFARDFYSALASEIEPISAFHRAQCASLERRISKPEEALTLASQEISRLAPLIALSARPAPAISIPNGHRRLQPGV
jgi:CHAT domain-containing protein